MQEEIEISASEEKGWLGKIKDTIYENWQTLLVALIVLIVGVSAYNYNTKHSVNQAPAAQSSSQGAADANASDQGKYVQEKDQEAANAQDQNAAAAQPAGDVKAETKTEAQNTNTVTNSGDGYTVTAAAGDGITHLARKAIAQYLSENADSGITAVHKIYAEDYLQNMVGNQRIKVGHQETFSKASIAEAIGAAQQLSQKSLDHLKKYETQVQ